MLGILFMFNWLSEVSDWTERHGYSRVRIFRTNEQEVHQPEREGGREGTRTKKYF